jgi:hypothetical protein
VIRLSFAEGVLPSRQALDRRIEDQLRVNRDALGVSPYPNLDVPGQFAELIRQSHARFAERVVVLVDEYDRPILDNITDRDTARQMRDKLSNLYSVIKGQDARPFRPWWFRDRHTDLPGRRADQARLLHAPGCRACVLPDAASGSQRRLNLLDSVKRKPGEDRVRDDGRGLDHGPVAGRLDREVVHGRIPP